MANAAFFCGMMNGLAGHFEDVRTALNFDDVKANFLAAARDGIRAQMNWCDDRQFTSYNFV